MKPKKKIDVTLLIGLAIPVVMIVLIAAAIYLPRLVANVEEPKYDFLYTVGYAQGYRCYVEDGRLRLEEPESDCGAPGLPGMEELQFFIHRVKENTSERVSFEEASDLRLDNTALSPDGFEIAYGRKSEFFFPMFSSRDYRTRYLRKDGFAEKLELEVSESSRYAYSFKFLGWIEE